MTKKIVLVSDNHSNHKVLKDIYNQHLDADYFLHCGDSEMSIQDIRPYISVKGNNDLGNNFPESLLLDIANKRIFILHGHRYINIRSIDSLIYKALELKADICMFGHTHRFTDFEDSGIRFINPGSCNNSRDLEGPSYAVIYIDDNDIRVVKHLIKKD